VYLFGESYAGHWIPSLSTQILAQNAQGSSLFYNLQGIGMGSPWIDPLSQSMVYSSFSYSNGLINGYQQSIVDLYQNYILNDIQENNLIQANTDRSYLLNMISSFAGGANIFNFRRFSHYSYSSLTSYMNSITTKTMFHATTNIHWENCNSTVDNFFASDHMNSTVNLLSSVLAQGIKVLIYHGQDDLINPITSMGPVFALLNWGGVNDFNNAQKANWYVNNTLVGYAQSAGNLTYTSLFAAGHYADHDQPLNIKDMVLRFINGTSWY
jgi:carboxypeptidase C (cathepsin A)